jgi:hypothetical protein
MRDGFQVEVIVPTSWWEGNGEWCSVAKEWLC